MPERVSLWAIAVAALCVAPAALADQILFSESFDGASLPTTLNYTQTDPFFTWSIDGSQQLFADKTAAERGVATAISHAGFGLPPGGKLLYSADMGKPAGASGSAYHVALIVGDYIALFNPGFPEGAFRLEKIEGAIDPIEPRIQGRTDMGFTPALDALHHVEVLVMMQGSALALHFSITGLGLDTLPHTFNFSFLDPTPGLGAGRIGVAVRGGAPPSSADDAFFDNLEVRLVPEPATLTLCIAAAVALAWRRKRREA